MEVIEEIKEGFKKTKIGWIPDDWTVLMIHECMNICNTKRTPISELERRKIKGIYPYYGPTKIQDYLNIWNYQGEYVLIAEDGDHFLKYKSVSMTQMTSGRFNVNNHVHVLRGTDTCLTEWFYWFYKGRSTFRHITRQGAGRYKLNKRSLEQMYMAFPALKEQKKIAQILSTWDESITETQNLITQLKKRKKGLMQQLLTGKKRLSGFSGEWEKMKLGDITNRVTQKNSELNDNVVTISAKRGFVRQEDYFNKRVASSTLSGYILVDKGQFAYNKSYSKGYPMGAFKRLDDFEKAVVTTLYVCFSLEEDKVDSDFMVNLFEGGRLIQGLMRVAQEGGRAHGLLNISLGDFFGLEIYIPKLNEQQAIASVLNNADDEINYNQKRLDELITQKKGLMQKLLTGQIRVKLN